MTRHSVSAFASTLIVAVGTSCALPTAAFAQQRAADGVTHQRRRAAAVLDVLAVRDRSGHRPVRRRGDDARAVRRPRGAARARRRRRRLHAGVDDGRVRAARTGPAGEGRRAASGARATAGRRRAARVAAGRHHRHEGPLRRAHRQAEQRLGRQPAGQELHRAGQHHGRPRSASTRWRRRSRPPKAPACRWPSA